MFWSLVSFGDLPKKANEAWQMQSGVLQDLKRHGSKKPCWSRSLEGLGTLGRLGLKGLLLFVYPNLLSSRSIYRLEGCGEVFRRVLWFPLRYHIAVLSCICISFPLLLCLTFIVFCSCLCTRVVSVDYASFTLVSALR